MNHQELMDHIRELRSKRHALAEGNAALPVRKRRAAGNRKKKAENILADLTDEQKAALVKLLEADQ